MSRSPAVSIVPASVLLAALLGLMFLSGQKAVITAPPDPRLGYYMVHTLKDDEPVPEKLERSSVNGGCFLTSLPEMRGAYFMLPHPCAPVIRSIEFTKDGFQAGPRQGDWDDGLFDIKGKGLKEGAVFVEMRINADSTPVRWVMRKATDVDFTAARANP